MTTTFEYRDLTDEEGKILIDWGQRIMALGLERAAIQTERATSQLSWNGRKTSIKAEMEKNSANGKAIRAPSVAGSSISFRDITDAEVKRIADLNQRNAALELELTKIEDEEKSAEASWSTRIQDIDAESGKLSNAIATIRPVVITEK